MSTGGSWKIGSRKLFNDDVAVYVGYLPMAHRRSYSGCILYCRAVSRQRSQTNSFPRATVEVLLETGSPAMFRAEAL
jgi:hypothetical protein